jgi:gamma-glutamyltranspeptidase / glutathione hydrolase
MDNFSASQLITKPAVQSRRGIVAAQHRRAAEVGVAVLDRGGDAIDAAIATSFALGVLEPWMSGIGGGGAMVVYRAAEKRYEVIDFGMRSPASLRISDYPLSGAGVSSDLFPWAHVQDDRNVHGPLALAVPGTVDGMRIAHEKYARLPWRELIEPACALAEQGLLIDWFAVESIASAAADLIRYPGSRAAFLINGLPPTPAWSARVEVRLPQQRLAQTLRRLADAGPRDLYEGELARIIAREVQQAGGALSEKDLAAYAARAVAPLMIDYREARVAVTPELTGGPTLAYALRALSDRLAPSAEPDASAYAAYTQCLQEAYAYRLARMGDVEGARAPGCTSHFCVVDSEGNIAAVTQTLLSIFGSRLTLPEGAGKRCLTNYCPVIAERDDVRFGLGASGGRRILPSVVQLLSFLIDYGHGLNEAFHLPRIDASEGDLVLGDMLLDEAVHEALNARFNYLRVRRQTLPFKFACPSGVLRSGMRNFGATEIASPWADAVAQAG